MVGGELSFALDRAAVIVGAPAIGPHVMCRGSPGRAVPGE